MVATNSRPFYYARPHCRRKLNGKLEVVPEQFDIMEIRDGETNLVATLSNRGDRLNNILKRGIPLDDARKVFYEMDGKL